jgi:hypothetical protein
MKILARLPHSALLVAAIVSILAAAPAFASLYMHETPGVELVSIRLSAMAAPVGGANQTGQIRSLIIDERTAEGYRVKEHSFTATRVGREITIHVGGLFFFGADRLDGTIRQGSLTLAMPARDGTIRRTSFAEVSEDRWNAAVLKFKQVARHVRLGYEYRWWSNEEQQASGRLTENKRRFGDAKAKQAEANQEVQSATAAHASGKRRLAAAQKVHQAASELATACRDCDNISAIRSAEEEVKEAEQVIEYEVKHIRGDEGTALRRLASAQHDLEEKTRAIQAEPARSRNNYDAQSAGYDVQSAVYDVQSAIYDLQSALYDLKQDESEADSMTRAAADLIRAFENAIANDRARVQEARQRQATIGRAATALVKKLGLGKKRQ